MRNKTGKKKKDCSCVDMENLETRSCLGSNGFPWRYDSICDSMDWFRREKFEPENPMILENHSGFWFRFSRLNQSI